MIAYLFPGQGAQFSGMGRDLFDRFPEDVAMADRVLGQSIRALCAAPDATLRETQNTQPALFFVNALYHKSLKKLGLRPDMTAGHSLGELNALVAAGVFDLETGLRIAMQRGQAMALATSDESFRGGMVAASDLKGKDALVALLDSEFQDFDQATLNSPGQIALSGPRDRLDVLHARIEELGIARAAVLNVGCAFHSRYVKNATDGFKAWLTRAGLRITAPKVPVYSNVTAAPFPASPDAIIDLMVRQLVSPVRWMDSVRAMAATGPVLFQELGPRPVVTPLVTETIMNSSQDREHV